MALAPVPGPPLAAILTRAVTRAPSAAASPRAFEPGARGRSRRGFASGWTHSVLWDIASGRRSTPAASSATCGTPGRGRLQPCEVPGGSNSASDSSSERRAFPRLAGGACPTTGNASARAGDAFRAVGHAPAAKRENGETLDAPHDAAPEPPATSEGFRRSRFASPQAADDATGSDPDPSRCPTARNASASGARDPFPGLRAHAGRVTPARRAPSASATPPRRRAPPRVAPRPCGPSCGRCSSCARALRAARGGGGGSASKGG